MKYLIFFDINGTLIKRDSRTDLPFSHAVDKLLNLTNAMEGVDTSARSDQDVFMEVLDNHDLNYSDDLWEQFLVLYEDQLKLFWDTDVWRENVDACEFVKYVHEQGHYLSMITGELSIGAEYKLKKLGIWKYFKTGGFGEDGLKRFDIADSAYLKAKNIFEDDYDDLIVIGDTQLDIKTARHLKAKIISITTGSHSRDKLLELKPDYIIDEFKEIKAKF
jgi:phosphoglycolate phosphatase-like HAD superfamily hydrolase